MSGIEISGISIFFAAYENCKSNGVYSNHVTLFFGPTTTSQQEKFLLISFDQPESKVRFTKAFLDSADLAFKNEISNFFNFGGLVLLPGIMTN